MFYPLDRVAQPGIDVLDDVLVAVDDGLVEQARPGPSVLGQRKLLPRQMALQFRQRAGLGSAVKSPDPILGFRNWDFF